MSKDDAATLGLLQRFNMGIQAAFKARDGAGGPVMGPENQQRHGELDARTIREDPVRERR